MNRFEQVKRVAKEILTPENYVLEAVPWINELKLPWHKVSWIAEVKRNSDNLKDEDPERKTAFDLIELHLMIQRGLGLDEFSHRRAHLQKEIEKKADELISYILRNAEIAGSFLGDELKGHIQKLRTATTLSEKLTVITIYINAIHHGGNPSGMNIFGGYPKYENWGGKPSHWEGKNVHNFFATLNDL